jgi:hypothetical protein
VRGNKRWLLCAAAAATRGTEAEVRVTSAIFGFSDLSVEYIIASGGSASKVHDAEMIPMQGIASGV